MIATWYYMRDNHTFRKLSGDEKDIRHAIMEEFLDGYTYGMLCTKTKGYEHITIHASGKDSYKEFIEQCLKVME
jgi:hypothetical protein